MEGLLMGFGNYDEDEHEKREEKMNIDTTDESLAESHNGEVTTEGGDDTGELLDRLADMKRSD